MSSPTTIETSSCLNNQTFFWGRGWDVGFFFPFWGGLRDGCGTWEKV